MVSKNKLFIFWSIFSLLWIFFNNLLGNNKIVLLILIFLIILFLQYYNYSKKYFFYIFIMCFWFLFWILISNINLNNIEFNEILLNKYNNNLKHNLVFEIIDSYKIKDFNNEYIVKVNEIDKKKINSNIKAVLSIPINFNLEKWYIVELNEKLYEFENLNEFEYKKYMLSKDIYFKTYTSNYIITEKKELNLLQNNILKTQKFFLNTINKIYTNNEAIFLWWILIWARKDIPNELKINFNNSWLTHIIAVSGFNITILILFLTYLLKFFPVFIRTIIITWVILFFTLLVWDTAPVIRASIMWLIWYYIIISWRKPNSLSIILLTAIIMVSFSPFSLNYDVSLHLSFLATIWIIYTQNLVSKIFSFLPNFLEIKTAFVLSLASLSFSLPIIIFNFWQISILSPIANILVAWTIPLAMLFWFVSIIVYWLSNIWWIIIWYIAWILLKWDILIVNLFWSFEWSIIKINFWVYKYYFELLYFIILIFLIIWFRKKEKQVLN